LDYSFFIHILIKKLTDMAYINVDVDINDIYDDLDDSEKQDLVALLAADGFLSTGLIDVVGNNILDSEWRTLLSKLDNARYQLSAVQEKILQELVKNL
jgi:hypothetical protein